jgi:2-polyprenyl-6-methoxyphenol hydroxylase-like FAD-dependent oxidoreductase
MSEPVVIVGGGPAGAALSYILARNGIRVTLLERHDDFGREFRGEGVQPSGLECIEQMGLAEALAEVPQTRIARTSFGIGGEILEMPIETSDLEQVRLVSQPGLLEMLTDAAAEFPEFELRMGTPVRDLERDASGRVTGVRLASGEVLAARYVVATDGRHSIVRKRLGLELEQIEQGFDVLWSRGPLEEGPLAMRDGAYVEILPGGGMVSTYPAPAGGHQIGVIIRKGQFKELRAAGVADNLDWVLERCRPEFRATLERAREQLCRPVLLDVICGRAPSWSAPGVLLIGDAAHPMSPIGGQGINMALRDALVAANHLVPLLRPGADASPDALDRAAAAVQAERSPEIEAIQALQTSRGKGFDRQLGRVGLGLLRLALRLPVVARALMRRRRPFGHGRVEVSLQV